ncbi:MAG: PorV/PorQ family protein [Candidatus Poribacteria bacterium]|nr:PorV/PorQ family protein [Candidatus Poribacteria bacterium]
MNRFFTYTLITVLTFACIPVTADNTDIHENAGTRAMTFLKIGVGAKAMGMGESQVAATDDLYASYWNPAGLAKLQKPQLALMHNEWFADINHEFVGIALPLGSIGTVGASASYLSFGELQGRDRDGNETAIFRPYDLAMIFSYARGFGNSFALGANAKFLREQIADETGTGIAFDFGALYTFPDMPLSLGVNAQHLGPRVTFIEEAFGLPVTIRLGAAYRLWNEALVLTTDVIRPTDNDIAIGLGAGYTIGNILQLRTGYKYQIGGNDLGAISGLTGGFGLTLLRFQVDYALVPFGVLGLTHRFSLVANF